MTLTPRPADTLPQDAAGVRPALRPFRAAAWSAIGLFLVVAAVYFVASPGRIDMIDGQYRYEVARQLLDTGSAEIRDPALFMGAIGAENGRLYSPYSLAGSLTGVPAILFARATGQASEDRERFFFSLTSGLFGAAAAALLFMFSISLGVCRGGAVGWTLVSAFATLVFPVATSVFDQPQHAFFVLAACFLAFMGAQRDSTAWAAAGGLAAGFLLNFQESYALIVPALGLATLSAPAGEPAARRRSVWRYAAFLAASGAGAAAWLGFNALRFGDPLFSGKGAPGHPSIFGNPLVGLAGLLLSPGKSVLLYSPPTILAVLGLKGLWKRAPRLGLAVVATALVQLALISSLTFFGGDWCWGPRYLVAVMPLLALGFPMVSLSGFRRAAAAALVVTGLCVQILGISLDHHRFFYQRALPDFFWYDDRWFYFRHSALLSRPAEIVESLRGGVPPSARLFRPGPYAESVTYAVFGTPPEMRAYAAQWMKHYAVFWLPRPWPLWMRTLPEQQRPVAVSAWLAAAAALAALGAAALAVGRRLDEGEAASGGPADPAG